MVSPLFSSSKSSSSKNLVSLNTESTSLRLASASASSSPTGNENFGSKTKTETRNKLRRIFSEAIALLEIITASGQTRRRRHSYEHMGHYLVANHYKVFSTIAVVLTNMVALKESFFQKRNDGSVIKTNRSVFISS